MSLFQREGRGFESLLPLSSFDKAIDDQLPKTSRDAEIGIQARLRGVCRKAWRFKSSSRHKNMPKFGHLAQLVERCVYIANVGGSSPSVPTINNCRDSQGGHGGCLKNIRCQFNSDSRHK